MKRICGIDDAGRGPVIGPMVLTGVLVTEEKVEQLKELGVKDSKLLSAKKREALSKSIREIVDGVDIQIVEPAVIDNRESDGLNLNDLEALKCAEIINVLKPDVAIIDCPSNNIKAWTSKVREFLSHECELVVEHKADLNHPEVSAASIVGKVVRDAEVKKIEEMVGMPIGSGYPSDPVTKKFIQKHHEDFPDIFRKSWGTYQNLVVKKKQHSLKDF